MYNVIIDFYLNTVKYVFFKGRKLFDPRALLQY